MNPTAAAGSAGGQEELLAARLAAVRRELGARGLDGLLICSPENRRYLSGFSARDYLLTESSGFLLISEAAAYLLTDFRYQEWAAAEAPCFTIQVYRQGLGPELAQILPDLGIRKLGFEAAYLSYATWQKVTQAVAEQGWPVEWQPVVDLVEPLRAIKAEAEVELLRRALEIAEEVLARVGRQLRPGLPEKEVAWLIEQELQAAGSEGSAFPPIVASGPNSARPHHHPGPRPLQAGEPIILDLGAVYQGYCSDITRTLVLGEPDSKFREIYGLVRRAQQRAEQGLRANMRTDAADALAREVIQAAGYGDAFGHALGHGVGLAVHEAPSLSSRPESATLLQPGMVTTVEPGIYLPGWGGIRLEDMVLIQAEGAEVLNRLGFYQF